MSSLNFDVDPLADVRAVVFLFLRRPGGPDGGPELAVGDEKKD
jgi:hypothetical protein